MKKRDRIKHMTRKQIERLMAIGRRTWMSINETLKNGKWKDGGNKDEQHQNQTSDSKD